jgi:hypothetical protein
MINSRIVFIVAITLSPEISYSLTRPRYQPIDRCIAMQEWLIEGGGYVHPDVEICVYPEIGGFGLKATKVRYREIERDLQRKC